MCAGFGLFIGLFTALVEAVTRRAWVRLLVGRREGREYALDSATTTIGRDERAHIPLFGDMSVAPLHATIVRSGSQFILRDAGSPVGIGVNGVRVPEAVLQGGDTIQIGGFSLEFMNKSPNTNRQVGPLQPIVQQGAAVTPMATPMQPVAQPQVAWIPTLVVISGPQTGQRLSVTGNLAVGREGAGLALVGDSQASRQHCVFEFGPSGLSVRDLGSTNGTFVNGAKVPASPLRVGDTVTIGSTQIRVE
jgi:pSer/pThr/pTyr-binding forkhead associated (FHA) protein